MDILVVYKKSNFEIYSSSPDKETREFIASNHEHARRMRESEKVQKESLEFLLAELDKFNIKYELKYRADLSDETTKNRDLLISAGGDGTFLEVSHYVEERIPVLGYNTDHVEGGSTGFYCIANKSNIRGIIGNIDDLPRTKASRLELNLNGKRIKESALNDVAILNDESGATIKYEFKSDNQGLQKFKTSGLLACTAMGSTAWMYKEWGEVMPIDSRRIQYHHLGNRSTPSYTEEFTVNSLERQGVIKIDGAHLRFPFSLGSALQVRLGKPITIIGDFSEKRKQYK